MKNIIFLASILFLGSILAYADELKSSGAASDSVLSPSEPHVAVRCFSGSMTEHARFEEHTRRAYSQALHDKHGGTGLMDIEESGWESKGFDHNFHSPQDTSVCSNSNGMQTIQFKYDPSPLDSIGPRKYVGYVWRDQPDGANRCTEISFYAGSESKVPEFLKLNSVGKSFCLYSGAGHIKRTAVTGKLANLIDSWDLNDSGDIQYSNLVFQIQ